MCKTATAAAATVSDEITLTDSADVPSENIVTMVGIYLLYGITGKVTLFPL
jgi:hypothetical protein